MSYRRKSPLIHVISFVGVNFDADIYTSGGSYHKVELTPVDDGGTITRRFFSRDKAEEFAKQECGLNDRP